MLVGRRIDFSDVRIFGHEIDDLFFQQSILDVADLIILRQLLDVGLWRLLVESAKFFFYGAGGGASRSSEPSPSTALLGSTVTVRTRALT